MRRIEAGNFENCFTRNIDLKLNALLCQGKSSTISELLPLETQLKFVIMSFSKAERSFYRLITRFFPGSQRSTRNLYFSGRILLLTAGTGLAFGFLFQSEAFRKRNLMIKLYAAEVFPCQATFRIQFNLNYMQDI